MERSSAEIRRLLGENLGLLIGDRSVADICREVGINRTQFNRYRRGEAFPRPDVLDRICRYFGTDARILTEPLPFPRDPRTSTWAGLVEVFEHASIVPASPTDLPDGFYRFVRLSPVRPEAVIIALLHVRRNESGEAIIRGFSDRRTFAEVRLPFRRPPPEMLGICVRIRYRLGVLWSLSGTTLLNFVQLFPDPFGVSGRYTGDLAIVYWRNPDDRTPANRILMTRIDSWRDALRLRRNDVGPRLISDLDPGERAYFEG